MRRARHRPISNINVIPYLDVLLVLLVIFMITTPLLNQGVVDLPSVGDNPLPSAEATALEIAYDQTTKNPYRLLDHKEGSESTRLTIDELLDELRKKHILYNQPTLIISAEKNLLYQDVFRLIGALRDAGYNKIALSATTETPQ